MAPSAVIFLAVIGLVVWYRQHEGVLRTNNVQTTSTLGAEVKAGLDSKPGLR